MSKIKCADQSNDCVDYGGYFKIYLSKTFKKHYGRKGIERKPWCLNCLFRFLEGGMAEWDPDFLIKIKRIS